MSRTIVIGSRGSKLALWQAHHVQDQLTKIGLSSRIEVIKTQGDLIQNIGFDKMEGKGFFTKEIEEALLKSTIDLAVHSHKDLETTSPDGLTIAAVSERENPADWLLIRKESANSNLPLGVKENAVVGTSSARRKSLLGHLRADCEVRELRGNVPTRIQKLRNGEYDAIVLAAAGVTRLELDLSDLVVEEMDPKVFVPAPAQGVLGLQIRTDDVALFAALDALNDGEAATVIGIERQVLRLLNGGCQMPLGVYCEKTATGYQAWATLADDVDAPVRKLFVEGNNPNELPVTIVERLKKKAKPES